MARVLDVHPDSHGVVRTVTVGLRGKDRTHDVRNYVPRPLERLIIGIQRLAVICPKEDQVESGTVAEEPLQLVSGTDAEGFPQLEKEVTVGDVTGDFVELGDLGSRHGGVGE